MNILITGGSGFIGTHLAIKLFEMGHVVTAMDITHPDNNQILLDYRNSRTEEELDELEKRYILAVADLSDDRLYTKHEDFKEFDLIYHLASPIGVKNITNHSGSTLREATRINQFIDYICSHYNIPVIYSSSSEVFGSGEIKSDNLYSIKTFEDSPRWSYAASKVHGEFLFLSGTYSSSIVRFFNVIGIGQKTNGMVVPTFIEAAKSNNALHVLENGIRSYCDVREALDYIIPIGLDLVSNTDKYNKKCFNIGNQDNVISADALAEKIIEFSNSMSQIIKEDVYKEQLPVRKLIMDDELLLELDVEHIELDDILINIIGDIDDE